MHIRIVSKLDDWIAIGEKALAVLLFIALVTLMLFNIISRNLFDTSIPKMMEIVPALVVWLAFVGGTLAFRNQKHIRLELFVRFLPAHFRSLAAIITSLFGITVMLILFIASLEFVKNEVDFFGPWGWCAVNFPLFFGICAFRYFVKLMEHLLRVVSDMKVR